MNKRPLPVTIIGWVFIAAGTVGLLYHAPEFKGELPGDYEVAVICAIRLLAIVGGGSLLRARAWARWLLIVWLVYHVILSAFHEVAGFVMHTALLGVIGFFLFRQSVSAWLRAATEKSNTAIAERSSS